MALRMLDIDEAIANGRIEVFYQPIARVATGACCGMEALARWRDPDRGLLQPQSFVPLLELNCEVAKLDACVLDLACRDIRARMDAGATCVPVSVNLSRLDFSCEDPVALVLEATRCHGVPAEKVVIEITETVEGDLPILRERVAEFREAGFSVWMDDFGTGYSSLSTLCDLDFTGIKIDMQFLMSRGEKGRAVVRHAVALGRDLGLGTLCEGTASEEDAAFLREVGCERAQGTLFGEPRPLPETLAGLEARGIALEA